MNKSKFKAVKFLPFDIQLDYCEHGYWISHLCFGGHLSNNIQFTDSCIEQYPELFDVQYKNTPEIKRWRAEINNPYWCISWDMDIHEVIEEDSITDQTCYDAGNYFDKKKNALQCLTWVKFIIAQHHNEWQTSNNFQNDQQ